MVNPPDIWRATGALLIAAWVLYRHLWRAVLFVAPGAVRTDFDTPAGHVEMPSLLEHAAREVTSLGFQELGSRYEKPLLGRETLYYEFAQTELKVFATLYLSRYQKPRLFFLSAVEGGFVITANYRRPAREIPHRYLSGGLENLSAERLFKAHRRRLTPFRVQGEYNEQARLAVARQWYSGPGKYEVRQQNAMGLLWIVTTLGLVAAAVIQRWG